MSRLLSVSLTEGAVRDRTKTVTRRLGWWEDKNGRRLVKAGDTLTLCRKVMGRRKGEPLVRLCDVEVVDVRREPLWDGLNDDEAAREGFPGWSRLDFYLFFRDGILRGVDEPTRVVTRIEWRYLDAADRPLPDAQQEEGGAS
jgi:hypothetical protein